MKSAAAICVSEPCNPVALAVPAFAPRNAIPLLIPTVSRLTPARVAAAPASVEYVTPIVCELNWMVPLKWRKLPRLMSVAVPPAPLVVICPVTPALSPKLNALFVVPVVRFSAPVKLTTAGAGPNVTVPALTPVSAHFASAFGPITVSLPVPALKLIGNARIPADASIVY